MTQDEIVKLAREAGIVVTGEAVWRLCELVAAAEREACIDIVAFHGGSVEIEAAIRARGE